MVRVARAAPAWSANRWVVERTFAWLDQFRRLLRPLRTPRRHPRKLPRPRPLTDLLATTHPKQQLKRVLTTKQAVFSVLKR
jgi:DDE family transposase